VSSCECCGVLCGLVILHARSLAGFCAEKSSTRTSLLIVGRQGVLIPPPPLSYTLHARSLAGFCAEKSSTRTSLLIVGSINTQISTCSPTLHATISAGMCASKILTINNRKNDDHSKMTTTLKNDDHSKMTTTP